MDLLRYTSCFNSPAGNSSLHNFPWYGVGGGQQGNIWSTNSTSTLASSQSGVDSRRAIVGKTQPSLSFDDFLDEEDDVQQSSHPNKYAVALEDHLSPKCCYKRLNTLSGHYFRITDSNGQTFMTRQRPEEVSSLLDGCSNSQIVRTYRKHLVR